MMQIRVMRSAGVMARMQWRGEALLSRRSAPAGGEIRRDKSFRSSELSAILRGQEIASGRRRTARPRRVVAKTAKRKAVKLLKKHGSTKSSDLALNAVNGSPSRFSVTGFGAELLEKARPAPKPRWRFQRGRRSGNPGGLGVVFAWRNSRHGEAGASLDAKGGVLRAKPITDEDLEARTLLPLPRAITILGAPVEAGASVPGAAMGPAMLRTAGIVTTLRDLGLDVEDRGDLAPSPSLAHATAPEGKAHRFAEVAAWARLLANETYAVARSGRTPIVLGGDHSLAMGSIAGIARFAAEAGRELFVLWLDAHSDFNTPLTSPSGNMHGMSLAMLCQEPGLEAVFGSEPHGFVDPARLHLFGIRSIDTGERRLLQNRGVDVVDMRRLDEDGFAVSIRRIIDRVRARNGLLHVSLDVDFLDPAIAPGVGTAVPGGATYREAHLVMELLYESGLSPSLDLVELNPFLDERGRSALLLVDLTASLFGRYVYKADA